MPPESVIRSRQNPIYKQIRSLLRRDRRHQERAFLVEGPRFIEDAIATGAEPTLIAVAESTVRAKQPLAGRTVRVFDDELFESLSDTVHSQGTLAVFPIPTLTPTEGITPFLLVVDAVQDPGNLGTLIRSASGAGVTEVVVLPGTVDPWSPKTVRAAAAAHFLVPIVSSTVDALGTRIGAGMELLAADANADTSYDNCALTGPIAVVVGAEGAGLSASVRALDPTPISIPLESGLESLNAGVAGSVILFEASRQRRAQANSTKTPDSS